MPKESFAPKCTFSIKFRSQMKLCHRIDLVDDYCEQFFLSNLYILGSPQIFKMLVKTFENNGKNISKNIINLNLKQHTNLYCIIIWSIYVQRKHIFGNFIISLPDKTENSLWNGSQIRSNWVSLTYYDFNLYLVITRWIHKFKTTGWFQGHLSLSSFRDRSNGYQEFLVKSKLSS